MTHVNPLDMAVRVILAEKLTGVAYTNRDLYARYLAYCKERSLIPAGRIPLGRAMARFGAVGFLTNSDIGRCWYIPTPEERVSGIQNYLGTSCVRDL